MSKALSKGERRTGVLLNYLGLIGTVGFFYAGYLTSWNGVMVALFGLSLVILLISFFRYFFFSGLWRFVHTGSGNLDERQIKVTRESLRLSYSAFTVISLIVFLWISLYHTGDTNLLVIFAGLLYLAHILPATIIAWKEKEI